MESRLDILDVSLPVTSGASISTFQTPAPRMATNSNITFSVVNRTTVISAVFVAVAGATLALRLFTRIVLVKNVTISDCAVCLAWLTSVALTVFNCLAVRKGLGNYLSVIPFSNFVALFKMLWASVFCYNPALHLVKISIFLEYLKIFGPASARTRYTIWVFLILTLCSFAVAFFLVLFGCRPLSYAWDRFTQYGTCVDYAKPLYALSGFNLFTDMVLIFIPLPVIRRLHMPRKQKISVYFLLVLGTFGFVASIIRLYYLTQAELTSLNNLTRAYVGPATWSSIEVNVCIMCACLATLKPLFSSLLSTPSRGSTTLVRSTPRGGGADDSGNANGGVFSGTTNASSTGKSHVNGSSFEFVSLAREETDRETNTTGNTSNWKMASGSELYHTFLRDEDSTSTNDEIELRSAGPSYT